MNETNKFVGGLYYNEPHPNAPDFVLASLSIRPDQFIEWLNMQKPNNKGYVKISVKRSKSGNPYAELDTWEKTAQRGSQSVTEGAEETITPDDIPF